MLLDYTADNLNERDIPFYMIESVNQLQYNQQDGMYDLAGLVHYRTARVYAMAKEELEKITPEEAAMRFYISDLERNARVNLYPLYKKPLHVMNLTQTNLSYVKLVSQKLTDRGYTLGRASIMPSYYPNRLLLAITAAAAACGFVFVLNLLIPLSDRKNYILMALGIVCAVIGAIVAKGALFLQVWAIGCATAAPTAAILLALDHWKKRKITQKLGYGRVVRDGTIGLFFAVVVAMIGGLYIAAMLGNIRFFMEFDFYRGVKLTFVLPLLLVAIGYLRRFPLMGQAIASPADLKVFVKDFLNIPIKMGTILILAVLALAGIIFVGRSGSKWMESVCKDLAIETKSNRVDIGVRVELPAEAAALLPGHRRCHRRRLYGRNLCPYPHAFPHVLHPRHQRLGDGHGHRYRFDHRYCHRQLCDDMARKAGGPS